VEPWEPHPLPTTGRWDYLATYVAVSTADGITGRWMEGSATLQVCEALAAFAARAQGGFNRGPHVQTGCAYLRLRVRHVPPERVEALGRQPAVDIDHGPGGAPPDYPRVPLDDLLAFVAGAV
jgi:hypothetical protein